ncbi:hypothetical protein ES703_10467 [subsurface metagenome]
MNSFNEHGEKGKEIMERFEKVLEEMEYDFEITFKSPAHDISRRFLNEIKEFEQLKEIIK